MIANEINIHLPQYEELIKIEDKDEFLHCYAYEVCIRDIKEYLKKQFSEFEITNNELGLTEQGRKSMLAMLEKSDEYDEIKKQIASYENLSLYQKLISLKIAIIEDDILFHYGLNLEDLYIDYFFFDDEFKKIFNSLFGNSKALILKKELYDGVMESEAYFSKDYIRTYTYLPKKPNDDFRDIRTHYAHRYRRPMFVDTILSNNKKADLTINTDLPKDIIMQQVEKLVDIILNDKKNIYSNKDKVFLAEKMKYEKYSNTLFEYKEQYIKILLIVDYLELRRKEVEVENENLEKKKLEKIDYIKKSGIDTKDKKEHIREIKRSYSKIGKTQMRDEIADILDMGEDTIGKYERFFKGLVKEKNYLKLVQGKDIKKIEFF